MAVKPLHFSLLLTTAYALTAGVLQAGLVLYSFPGGAFTPTTTDPNVTSGAINATGSIGSVEPGSALANTVFYRYGALSTTPAAAVANNEFFQFTLTPNAGYELDFTSVTFDATRGGASTPRGFLLRTSLDGFTANVATADIPTANPTLTPFNISLSAPAFQNISSSTTFRLYQYAPSVGGVGTFYDNISVNGSANVIPEPSTLLFGLALLGVAATRRCRPRHF